MSNLILNNGHLKSWWNVSIIQSIIPILRQKIFDSGWSDCKSTVLIVHSCIFVKFSNGLIVNDVWNLSWTNSFLIFRYFGKLCKLLIVRIIFCLIDIFILSVTTKNVGFKLRIHLKLVFINLLLLVFNSFTFYFRKPYWPFVKGNEALCSLDMIKVLRWNSSTSDKKIKNF